MWQFRFTQKQGEAIKLISKKSTTLLYGGSRSGKTALIIALILLRANEVAGSRHAILRFRFNHVKQSVVYDTFPKMAALLGIGFKMNKTDWFATLSNGSEIWFGGLDDKERTEKVLGNEYATIFLNEASQISYQSYLMIITRLAQKTALKNIILIDENPPDKGHWTYKIFFEGIEPSENVRIEDLDELGRMQMNPIDNLTNLSDDYIKHLNSLPARQRRRFLDGEFSDIIMGALFNDINISINRVYAAPPLQRVLIAVDPAATSKITSDETGIISVGLGYDGHVYVLDDQSGIYKPARWGKVVHKLYKKYNADAVIGEANNGGEMVEHVVKTTNREMKYIPVWAANGKIARAEPVSAVYDNDEVHHVGKFYNLENEMVTYTGTPGEKSPNRLDALVWGVTALIRKIGLVQSIYQDELSKEDYGFF